MIGPKTVKVGPVTYTISEESILDEGLYGKTIHSDPKIVLHDGLAPDVRKLTLFHEIMHAVIEVLGGGREQYALLPQDPSDAEERIVRSLETPLFTVLRDNPAVCRYLGFGK